MSVPSLPAVATTQSRPSLHPWTLDIAQLHVCVCVSVCGRHQFHFSHSTHGLASLSLSSVYASSPHIAARGRRTSPHVSTIVTITTTGPCRCICSDRWNPILFHCVTHPGRARHPHRRRYRCHRFCSFLTLQPRCKSASGRQLWAPKSFCYGSRLSHSQRRQRRSLAHTQGQHRTGRLLPPLFASERCPPRRQTTLPRVNHIDCFTALAACMGCSTWRIGHLQDGLTYRLSQIFTEAT